MAIKFVEMVNGQIMTGSPVSYYTAPALNAATVQAATVYNPSGAAAAVNIYKVPTSRSADASTLVCTRSVAAGATASLNEFINHKLQTGTQIFATGNGLTLFVSGVEFLAE